jgi:hypothetical protein
MDLVLYIPYSYYVVDRDCTLKRHSTLGACASPHDCHRFESRLHLDSVRFVPRIFSRAVSFHLIVLVVSFSHLLGS